MSKVRCIRIIEYVGEIDWLRDQLERAYLFPGEEKSFGVGGTFREVTRTIQEVQELPSVSDEENPF